MTYINEPVSRKVYGWKLMGQKFDFNVVHIAGNQNVVADTCSLLVSVVEPFI
jgi:hypothetical protein